MAFGQVAAWTISGDGWYAMHSWAVRMLAVLAMFAAASSVQGQFRIQIDSPAKHARVRAGDSVVVEFSVIGASAGLSRVEISGARDLHGTTTIDFPETPVQTSYADSAIYHVPAFVGGRERLRIVATAIDSTGARATASVMLYGIVGAGRWRVRNRATEDESGTVQQSAEAEDDHSARLIAGSRDERECVFDEIGNAEGSIQSLSGVAASSDNEQVIVPDRDFVEAAAGEPTWAMYE